MTWTKEMRAKALEKRRAKPKSNGVTATFLEEVEWEKIPMAEAQQQYARLKKLFEHAGFILNQRSMPAPGTYVCSICETSHSGNPNSDYSYINPKTGLMQPILACGERCWLIYQQFRIQERRARESGSSLTLTDFLKEYAKRKVS